MLTSNTFDSYLNSKSFLLLVKQNRENLRASSTVVNITADQAATCKNNFYRLLRELGFNDTKFHQVALVLNGFDTPREFDHNREIVYLPSPTPLQRMLSKHKTTYPKDRL